LSFPFFGEVEQNGTDLARLGNMGDRFGNSRRAREGAAVEQDVLPGNEAGLDAAQEGAGVTELVGVAETPKAESTRRSYGVGGCF
jgi:hypothetical protein